MASYTTREIYTYKNGYREKAGYAKFDANGKFLGTFGGYGRTRMQQSSRGKSKVQEVVNGAARDMANRNPAEKARIERFKRQGRG